MSIIIIILVFRVLDNYLCVQIEMTPLSLCVCSCKFQLFLSPMMYIILFVWLMISRPWQKILLADFL